MNLDDFMVYEAILPELESVEKPDVIKELVTALKEAGEISGDDVRGVTQALMNRERLGSTGIGKGVAVPHAKHHSVKRPIGTIGRSMKGVDFSSLDGAPVDIIFLLISPPDPTAPHIRALERIATLLRNEVFCRFVRQAKGKEEIMEILKEAYVNMRPE